MLTIGCHLSASKGYLAMARDAVSIGANTFQFFTRNPRGGKAKDIDPADVEAFHAYCAEHGISTILAHAPYTLNAAAAKPEVQEFARATFADDLVRMEATPHQMYNFHPGSHVGQGAQVGIEKIASVLNEVLAPEQTTTVLLETMAGKGTEIGRTFEELRAIIDRVVGLGRLRAIHLNDSMNPLGAHKDRHAAIGQGHIGFEALHAVTRHPALCDLPFFLETPHDTLAGYAEEIARLRQ